MSEECERTMLPKSTCAHCTGAAEAEKRWNQSTIPLPFIARYTGTCKACGYDINVGDRLVYPEGEERPRHERC